LREIKDGHFAGQSKHEYLSMNIYLIAIGGSAMHNLAMALHLAGHTVMGSDDEIFEPARSRLAKYGLLPEIIGWNPDRIHTNIDLVILGMHARADNPELLRARELGIPIQSYPEFIFEQSKSKTRVVIAGSHGKTTTTSMVMHVLRQSGMDFDFLVGAMVEGFDVMVRLSDAPVIVIEGDEYLSSAIDRRPKFLHYHPQISVMTGIAWDHINVFPTFENYLEQFRLFVQSLPDHATVYYYAEDPYLSQLKASGPSSVVWHGYDARSMGFNDRYDALELNGHVYTFRIFGRHNMENMMAARHVCHQLGIEDPVFFTAMQTFEGAARRLQPFVVSDTTAVYFDFAHSPSKVAASTEAVRQRFPEFKLVAILELHTYSSLNIKFIGEYKGALDQADEVLLFFDQHALELKRLPPLDPKEIEAGIAHRCLRVFENADHLAQYLDSMNWANCAFLFMSSGNFGGRDFKAMASDKCRG
jgi:UDP-N-acetylmuramate: L-alanyl-gamma-D-glutamyl-meso-diaminopimelate ligase